MFEKQAEKYASDLELIYKKGVLDGYNKAKVEIEYDLMMKLKDEGIVKPLKDSILRNERLSSQEQQELCAWIECAMDFGENLDKCTKELEQIRNERNLFQERCEDIEFNYYCDKVDCQFLSRNEWHYVKDGDLPTKELEGKQLLVRIRNYTENFIFAYYMLDLYYSKNGKRFYSDTDCNFPIDIGDVIAWKEIVFPKED
jgi:hypothetical protein